MTDDKSPHQHDWKGPLWLSLLVASSVAFTLALACATPFPAFAAIAACTLPRRDAYALAAGVWLANQAVGFAFLGYPWTANCLAWGAALGMTALLSTLAARQVVQHLGAVHSPMRHALAFLAAFAAYEAALIASSLVLGGIEVFTPAIQGRIFAIHAGAWLGLIALHQAGVALGLAAPRRLPAPLPR